MTKTNDHLQAPAGRRPAARSRWRFPAAALALTMISSTACTADGAAPPAAVTSPSAEATALVGPGRGTGYFGGSDPEVSVTYTMPAGWQSEDVFVTKTGADPVFGLVFSDVWNLYADGCRWRLMDPPVGPSVEDLVAAYATLPGFGPAAREVTIDGYEGQQIQLTMPDYDATECTAGMFGIFQDGNAPSSDQAPHLWAQAPGQVNTMWILDVDGSRLQILSGYPPGTSEQDRKDLDEMVASVDIG